MRKAGAAALTAGLFVLVAVGLPAEAASRPPTDLKKVGDHWTAWDPPAAGSGAYIIQRGDTLWDLSNLWFGDPFLWPQIWDENRYILDSHWIYPGDPLVVPGRPTVVPDIDEGVIPIGEDTSGDDAGDGGDAVATQMPALTPAAVPEDLYCSGYIEHVHDERPMWVVSLDDHQRQSAATGDVVFLNQGSVHGVRAGQEFAVVRSTDEVYHPVEGKRSLGTMIRRLGKLRVLVAHEASSTAVITQACDDIQPKDQLVPWQDIPVPMLSGVEAFRRWDVSYTGGPTGHLVASRDGLESVAEGHVVYTDLGYKSGAQPGDIVVLYRDREDPGLPRIMLAQAVVLTVGVETSSAKILGSVREARIGDQVEIRR